MEFVAKHAGKVSPSQTDVKTAGGHSHVIRGVLRLPVSFNSMTREITFYICPTFQQYIYLGIDFWREFELAPDIVGIAELNNDEILNMGGKLEFLDKNQDELSEQQRQELDKVSDFYHMKIKG